MQDYDFFTFRGLCAEARLARPYKALHVSAHTETGETMGDSNLGTWTLNVAKSTYDPGPPPMSETAVLEPWETDGVTTSTTLVLLDGTRASAKFSTHYDGSDYKVSGVPDFDTIACNRVDATTTAYTVKKDETVIGTATAVVSNGGKTRTFTATWTNAQGQRMHQVRVHDKE